MIPVIFHLGPMPLFSFGLMMVCAFLCAWRRLSIELDALGIDPSMAESMISWAAVGGIVGARLGYILSFPNDLWNDPFSTVFSNAGFVFHWGFAGGALAVYFLLRRNKLSFLPLADASAVALAIGYGVGRIGCQLSGDGDYGKLSSLPWAMGYPYGVIPTPPGALVHPAPVYETLGAFLIAILLSQPALRARLSRAGQVFGLYLLLSAAARFLVEFVRVEPIIWRGLSQAQINYLMLAPFGLLLLLLPRKKPNHVPE